MVGIIARGSELALHCGGRVARVGDVNTLWWMNCQSQRCQGSRGDKMLELLWTSEQSSTQRVEEVEESNHRSRQDVRVVVIMISLG